MGLGKSLVEPESQKKTLKKNLSMVDKIKINLMVSQEELLPKKENEMSKAVKIKHGVRSENKESNSSRRGNEIDKKPKNQLFSEVLSKSEIGKKEKPDLNKIRNINKIIPSEMYIKPGKTKVWNEVNPSMFESNILDNQTKSYRETRVPYKKFRNTNSLKRSSNPKVFSKSKNPESIQFESLEKFGKIGPMSKKINVSKSNADFIEKSNVENTKRSNVIKVDSKKKDSNTESEKNPKLIQKLKQNQESMDSISHKEHIKSVYNSIGKIKEFVKQNSAIDLNVEKTKTESLQEQKKMLRKKPSEDEIEERGEVMQRIRAMAKKIKRSRQEKKKSLKLVEITKEMDDIIGQIDQIQNSDYQKSPTRKLSRRKRKFGSKGRNGNLSHFSQYQNKNAHSSQIVSSNSKDRQNPGQTFSKFAHERKARKLNNFKNMINRPKLTQKKLAIYGGKRLEDKTPVNVSNELEQVFKSISNLEKYEPGEMYHQSRKKKLKTIIRSSKLEDIRRTMNLRRGESDEMLKTQSDLNIGDQADRNFMMKKCPACQMYFPREKILDHSRTCLG